MRPVTLRINNRIVDLKGGESLGIDFASFDVDEVTKRKGALSINFTVPATANNRQIFENAQEITNLGTLPFQILSARLYVEGVDVNITRCELMSATQDEFELRLYNDDSAVFLALKERTLGELDLSGLDHFQNGQNVADRIPFVGNITYPLLQSSEIDFPHNNTDRKFITYAALPCIYMDTLISSIFGSLGYDVVDTITDYSLALPPSDNFKRNKDKRRYLGTARSTATYTASFGNVNWLTFNQFANNVGYNGAFFEGLFDPVLPTRPQQGEPTSWIRCADVLKNVRITFTAQLYNPNSSQVSMEAQWYLYDKDNVLKEIFNNTILTVRGGQTATFQSDFEMPSNIIADVEDSIRMMFVWVAGTSCEVSSPEFTIVDLDIETPGVVQVYEACNVIPFLKRANYPTRWVTANSIPKQSWKWGDLIREYLKLTGGVMQFDHIRKKVYFSRLNAIQDNLANPYLWTNKVDDTELPKIEFANDQYGQRNNFTYQEPLSQQSEDANGDPLPRFDPIDGTNFTQTINNTNLKPEEDLIESDFSFSRQVEMFIGYNVARVPTYKYINPQVPNTFDAPQNFERNSIGQPIVLIRQVTDYATPLEVYREFDLYPSGAILTKYTYNVAWFIDTDQPLSLGWGANLVNTFYSYLIDIITNYKKVTLRLRLNAVDIKNLNFQRPVYISGTYYYINAVNGYDPISGESTEVELIKLNPYG